MTTLVTGASGFVGLNYLTHLAQRQPSVRIIAADLETPEIFAKTLRMAGLTDVQYRQLDVQDRAACHELLQETRPRQILHAAAITSPQETSASAELTAAVNVGGAENLLKAAVACGSVERCLLVSSSGVYDQAAEGAFCDEGATLDLTSAYARSKLEAELLMEKYEKLGGFLIAAARLGPVYGRFERSRPTRLVTSFIQRLLDALCEGRHVRVAGREMHRDWTYAADVAAAFEALLLAPVLRDRIYNVSSGVSISTGEIFALFADRGLQIEWTSREAAEIVIDPTQSRKPLSITRLKRDTNFHPAFDLHAGITAMLASAR